MNLLDESLIERYVRFRSTMTKHDVERVARLLQISAAARDLADFFRGFYEEFDLLEDSPSDSQRKDDDAPSGGQAPSGE